MINKIGRNDLCSCGSGKKFKKCCINHGVATEVIDLAWINLRQLEGIVIDKHLNPYATQFSSDIVQLAISECFPEELPEELDPELLFNNFFIPWFLFNWIPLENFGIQDFDSEKTISQNYAEIYSTKLNRAEKRFISAMNETYYSFYAVYEVELGKRLVVKDIILGTTHAIKERQGTHYLKRGDIVFARILNLDNQSIFIGMAPFIVPTHFHHNLIDFKDWLIEENDHQNLTEKDLRDVFDMDLLEYFFEIIQTAYGKSFPSLFNTDGDLMQFSKSYFKLAINPEEALHQLLPLTLSKNDKEFLQDAERDNAGNIQKIEMPWLKKGNKKHKDWENTVLGHITIEKNRLILDTNSEKRTEKGKKLLNKYLGDKISFQSTLIESPDQKIKSMSESSQEAKDDSGHIDLSKAPEQVKAMAQAHWKKWFNEPIPALNDRTPREASKTEKGREKLEALLLQYERYDAASGDKNLFRPDIKYLRKELGLD